MRAEATKGAVDGGRGEDSRAAHFSARTKAKDFEDEAVLADALRFLFRSCKEAEAVFGELQARTRLQKNEIPEGYYKAARALRQCFEDRVEKGEEKGPLLLDRSDRHSPIPPPCGRWSFLERRYRVLQQVVRKGNANSLIQGLP